HRLQGAQMRSGVVIRLHEILDDYLPVEWASPFTCIHHNEVLAAPLREVRVEPAPLFSGCSRRIAIEIHKHKAMPNFATEFPQPPFGALKTGRLMHLGTSLQSSVEFEGPRMIRTKE